MAKTAWSPNPTLDATQQVYDSATVKYDSAVITYDGIDPTKVTPSQTAWTPVTP